MMHWIFFNSLCRRISRWPFSSLRGAKSCWWIYFTAPSPPASVEIIRRDWSLAGANFFPLLQNKIIKRMRVKQRHKTPTVPGSLLPVMEYSCGVSHDKTQKVVLSPCLSPHTLGTAAACLRACVRLCVRVCLVVYFGVRVRAFLFFLALACCLAVFPVSL